MSWQWVIAYSNLAWQMAAVVYAGSVRPSTVSKTSPTRSPAVAAGPPSTRLTTSTDPDPDPDAGVAAAALVGRLRTVTPMPPLSAGRSYFASSALYAPGVK